MPHNFIQQRTLPRNPTRGLHVAIVMDGNGRWAAAHGKTRPEGHQAGVGSVRRIVEAAPRLGIGTLTLFAFSSDNWHRPEGEVNSLMDLLEHYLKTEAEACAAAGARIRVVGRRDRIPESLEAAAIRAERLTAGGTTLDLRLAVDYSARDAILRAACWMLSSQEVSEREFSRRLAEVTHAGRFSADVDLLIRTGGEQRLSDFMLWECAYAELVFTPKMWPEFEPEDLEAALLEFEARERRFGGVAAAAESLSFAPSTGSGQARLRRGAKASVPMK